MHLMKQDIHCVALAGQELKVILLFYPCLECSGTKGVYRTSL